ncbi:hypothetical protein [Nitratireductor rhodophyticola]|uniref:hypothetical protein n=1 Tax=Nitratireductor rhodophyticola TaxID=2854036 RepID=UPI003009522E
MTAAPALLHSIALCACLILQAMPGSIGRPSGIRRALQTLSAEHKEPRAMAVSAEALHLAGSTDPA